MAHFAKINQDNIVEFVVVVDNNKLLNEFNVEEENKGIIFLKSIFGESTNWVQTSYNHNFRARMAAPGYVYDSTLDIFISQKKYLSWTYSDVVKDWVAPVPYPNDNNSYYWDEDNQQWILNNI